VKYEFKVETTAVVTLTLEDVALILHALSRLQEDVSGGLLKHLYMDFQSLHGAMIHPTIVDFP
jgi:hypothetical protein